MFEPEKICLNCFKRMQNQANVCPHCGCDNSTLSNESHQLECGSILAGTYLIGKAIGQGGFGITYVGWDLNLSMKVAIKEYYPEGCVTRDTHTHVSVLTYAGAKEAFFQKGKERFVEEARVLARFSGDSGVVGVRTFFFENSTAYIVMDFVEGETLKSYAARKGGKLHADEVLTLFKPLMKSLVRVHDNNLLHRDISPDNIMIRPDGTLALLDFGAARQISAMGERSNTINVKHGYAPEEQYRTHGEQGPWTDIYALCATIYRLTTGVTPTEALDRAINETELTPPNQLGADFTPAQQSVIMRGLAVRANQRTQNMRELMEELYGDAHAHTKTGQDAEKISNTKQSQKTSGAEFRRPAGEKGQPAQEQANQTKQKVWARKKWPYAAVGLFLIVAVVLGFIIKTYTTDHAALENGDQQQTEIAGLGSQDLLAHPETSATVCIGPEPETLDPNKSDTTDGLIYITHLYEGLYRPNTDGSFSLGQAKNVEITDNPDGTAHVVATLRDDVKWSDGKPVTAYDFVYSWRRLCNPDTSSSYGYIGQDFFANGYAVAVGTINPDQLCVNATDDKTLEFDISANVPYMTDVLAFPCMAPLRQDIVEANPDDWSMESGTQVSNGRYTLSSFTHGDRLVLSRSETYWDTNSTKLDKLSCMLSDDDAAILAAFKAGELDFADSFPSDKISALSATPEYKQYGNAGLYYLEIQQLEGSLKQLKDTNIRKALSLAIDRDFLNRLVWNDSRIPAYSLVPYGITDATTGSDFRKTAGEVVGGDMSQDYAANVMKAKKLLADAGYPDGKGFPVIEYSINENTGHQAVAEAVSTMWKENLGIDSELVVMDWATYQNYRKTSSCQIARNGWLGDFDDPATFLELFTSSSYNNDGHYTNPEYDALVFAARTEKNQAKRMNLYHQAEQIIMNDMPIIPIVYYADDVLTQTYVTGLGVTAIGMKMFWDLSMNKP